MSDKYTSTTKRRKASDRPEKPYKDFPLYPHPLGYWAKKIRGTICRFGRWGRIRGGKMERLPGDGWKEALQLYKAQVDDLQAGRTPRKANGDEPTIADLCNKFLTAKLRRIESGELTQRSFQELKGTTDRLVAAFGKTRVASDLAADDFERLRADIAKTCGPVRLGNEITRIKSVLKYAVDNALVPGPIRYGSEFTKPDKAVLRREKTKGGKKLFTSHELGLLLDALDGKQVRVADSGDETCDVQLRANPALKAMVLLGVNAGAGNTDVANLEFKHLDLDAGWLHYARGKTGIDRRMPLWPETIEALRSAIATRPIPKDSKADRDIVLLTPRGERFVRVSDKSRTDVVTTGFAKLLRALKINGRKGLGFYSLRHTFATLGLQTGDRDAVKALMGHAYGDVLAHYDETGPSDDRLRAVVEHVRKVLFG